MAARPSLGLLAARVLVGTEERLDPVAAAMAGQPARWGCWCRPEGARIRRVRGRRAQLGVPAGRRLPSRLRRRWRGGPAGPRPRRTGWELADSPEVVAHHHPSPIRDPQARVVHVGRNDLWTLWLRRPLRVAVAGTRRVVVPSTERALGLLGCGPVAGPAAQL